MEKKEKIKQIVFEILECQIEDENESLWNYGFDSIKAIRLIVEMENEFNISVPNEFLAIEYWDTISKIKKLLSDLIEKV